VKDDLREWVIHHNISQCAATSLLHIWNKHHSGDSLPCDSRTLLQTPTSSDILELSDGSKCVYIGIANALISGCDVSKLPFEIKIDVNVDGVPLFKSSAQQLWPNQSSSKNQIEACPVPTLSTTAGTRSFSQQQSELHTRSSFSCFNPKKTNLFINSPGNTFCLLGFHMQCNGDYTIQGYTKN